MVPRILNSKAKTITFAALILGFSALLSRILGLFRDNLLANLLEKSQADIYFAAFRIPDLVYAILITGGITAAFLPVFSTQIKKSKREAELLVNNVLTFFLLALILISITLIILTPFLVKIIVPGFTLEQKALVSILTRIMFLSPILLGISAIFSGVLHYFNLFLITALAPICYNLGIIFGILFLRSSLGMVGLAWGVILGAFFHLAVQVPILFKNGFHPRFSFNFNSPGLKKIFKLMIPRSLGSTAYQINLIVITAIASTLAVGSIRIFNFANNLQGVAIGLIGLSFAGASFPFLSRHFANKEKEKFSENFFLIFRQIFFLVIPLGVLTFLLRAQIVRVILGTSVLGGGFFDWSDTRLTAACLGIFSVSLFASCFIPFLSRAFYSFQDTKTPVKIALFSMASNIVFSFFFVKVLSSANFFQGITMNFLKLKGVDNVSLIGLPLGLSLATIIQFFLLFSSLKKKKKELSFRKIIKPLLKILASSFLMGVMVYLFLRIFVLFFNLDKVITVIFQGGLAGLIGLLSYLLFSSVFKSEEPKSIWFSVSEQFKKDEPKKY